MKVLPGGYRVVGALNLCGAFCLLAFAAGAIAAPPPKIAWAEVLTVSSIAGLTGLGLVFAGVGLLRGPHNWPATRVVLFLLAPLLLIEGLWLGWQMVRALWWPTDAQSGLAILFLPLAAAVLYWAAILGLVGVRMGRLLGAEKDMPDKPQ